MRFLLICYTFSSSNFDFKKEQADLIVPRSSERVSGYIRCICSLSGAAASETGKYEKSETSDVCLIAWLKLATCEHSLRKIKF